jgi:hypothetical protein
MAVSIRRVFARPAAALRTPEKQNALPEQVRKGAVMNENLNPSGQRTSSVSIVARATASMRHESCCSDRNIEALL